MSIDLTPVKRNRVRLNLTVANADKLRAAAAASGRTMTELVDTMISDFLDTPKAKS